MKNTVGYTESINYRCLEDLQEVNNFGILNPLNLDYCGKEECLPGYKFGPYIRDNYVIHVVLAGKGNYQINGLKYNIEKGQAFLIPPGVETEYQADETDPWTYVWIGFHGYKVKTLLENLDIGEKNFVISLGAIDKYDDIMEQMLDARELTYVNGLRRMSLIYEFFASMVESKSATSHTEREYSDAMYVNAAVKTIIENYHKHLKIAEIADQIGINRSYLTNIFKKEIGISPQMFLINYRLDKAAHLLRYTMDPVGNIATSVGYVDSLCFSKAFKQKFGVNPSSYRKNPPTLNVNDAKNAYVNTHPL